MATREAHERILARKQEQRILEEEIRDYLIKAAVETVNYVACGTVFKSELQKKHFHSEGEIKGTIAKIAVEVTNAIRLYCPK